MNDARLQRRAFRAPVAAACAAGLALAPSAALAAPVETTATPSTYLQTMQSADETGIDQYLLPIPATLDLEIEQARDAATVSRFLSREPLATKLAGKQDARKNTERVVGTRFTTAPLNVRKTPTRDAKVVTVLDPAEKVKVTKVTKGKYRMVRHAGEQRWVSAAYLSKSKPKLRQAGAAGSDGGLSSSPCPTGSGVESGLVPNAVAVHRSVCAAFPSITAYGGYRAEYGSFHGTGQAVDIMVSGAAGDAVADYVLANAAALGVQEIIWSQRIWTAQRAGEGWRAMSDRGSATANHYDHVHVSVY